MIHMHPKAVRINPLVFFDSLYYNKKKNCVAMATQSKIIFGDVPMEINHKRTLQKAFLFQNMNDEEYTSLINCLSPQVRHFSKNEVLLLAGDPVYQVGIILRGTAHAHLEHIDGRKTLTSTLTPMKVFGEALASTGEHKSPVTIHAMTDITAAFIEYNKVYSMCATACAAHRTFLQNMLKVLGDRCFYLFDRINILREKSLRSKIMAYLYALSDNGASAVVTIPFTKTLLADYLLANRSALSKELSKMETEGLIVVNGRDIELAFLRDMLP